MMKKCKMCGKSLRGLVFFGCKCCNENEWFCNKHRLPEMHNCTFDFKELYKKQIEKENPHIIPKKLETKL